MSTTLKRGQCWFELAEEYWLISNCWGLKLDHYPYSFQTFNKRDFFTKIRRHLFLFLSDSSGAGVRGQQINTACESWVVRSLRGWWREQSWPSALQLRCTWSSTWKHTQIWVTTKQISVQPCLMYFIHRLCHVTDPRGSHSHTVTDSPFIFITIQWKMINNNYPKWPIKAIVE